MKVKYRTIPKLSPYIKNTYQTFKEKDKFIIKKLRVNLKIKLDKKKPNGTPRKKLDLSLAKKYGWKSKYSLNKGFDLTYDDYLKKIS